MSALVRLYRLKVCNWLRDKSFIELLGLINEMILEPNEIPKSLYETKKVMHNLDINYEKIHVCPNNYILYRGEEYKEISAQNVASGRAMKFLPKF